MNVGDEVPQMIKAALHEAAESDTRTLIVSKYSMISRKYLRPACLNPCL